MPGYVLEYLFLKRCRKSPRRACIPMMEAGIPAAGVYIGSWSEWVSDDNRPIKTGEEP